MVQQESFQRLAEVLDEVEAIDHLHRLGCPSANAIGVEVTAITTADGDRRMLGQPGGDAGRRGPCRSPAGPCRADECSAHTLRLRLGDAR